MTLTNKSTLRGVILEDKPYAHYEDGKWTGIAVDILKKLESVSALNNKFDDFAIEVYVDPFWVRRWYYHLVCTILVEAEGEVGFLFFIMCSL